MSQNKYDAIIVRTAEEDLKRDQYVNILSSMKNQWLSIVDLTVFPNPGVETYSVLFITTELLDQFDYDVPTFIEQYKSIIDNVNQTYEGTLAIEGDEYLIKIQ